MEYADKGDLQKIIQTHVEKCAFITEKFILKVLAQCLLGLRKLHSMGILHRDLKSANIFVDKQTDVKLGDMNVSKIAKMGLVLFEFKSFIYYND
jgi:NIMA (never in mitosis gene a)-related kinase